ncbi:MAG: alanyl-tRNA editing protein AlaXM [archaeon]
MEDLLYIQHPYDKEFDATVVNIIDGKKIVLDRTLFYPEGGGQPFDTGTLECDGKKFAVVAVKKREGKAVHEVDAEGLHTGDYVHGSIDWERRYKFMRMHTASHLLSILIHNETGAEITGNQLGLDKSRVDFSLEQFDRNFMSSFEEKANAIIAQHVPVRSDVMPREEAMQIPDIFRLRKAFPDHIQQLRIVTIDGLDQQACGGTHLQDLSEIGSIKILDLENKGKERRRMYFTIDP